jgi:hypothetical protein
MSSKVVLFELNEVPWRVILDHAERNPTGALARMLRRSDTYESVAEDRSLSPWITWSTVHRGVDDGTHGIINLNQDLSECDRAHPTLWSLLRARGLSVGVFGSMHSHPVPADPRGVAFHVPDPFATDSATWPTSVQPFQEFNLVMSRASGRNVSTKVPWRSAVDFAAALPRLGISARTLASVAGQLVAERRDRSKTARRRTFQSVLGFDVFMRLLETRAPDFSTFFTNHVAATMHRFWAAAYPGDYAEYGYEDTWRRTYADEIAWAMQATDDMLAKLERWAAADPSREVWITTSMGQAATRADNQASTQLYLEDVDAFMRHFGLGAGDYAREPAMLPRVVIAVDPARASDVVARISDVVLAPGQPLAIEPIGGGRFCLAMPVIQNHHGTDAMVNGSPVPLHALGFRNVAIEDESGQTAYHIAEGALIVHRSGATNRVVPPKQHISTLEVAPMLLSRLGVRVPEYMRGASRSRAVVLPAPVVHVPASRPATAWRERDRVTPAAGRVARARRSPMLTS